MIPDSLERALERTESILFSGRTPEAALASHEAGRGDADLDREVVDQIVAAQSADGSWDRDLVRTSETLLLLCRFAHVGAATSAGERGVDWLLTRQNAPGHFGDGCDAARHALGFCHHFLRGFFAAAAPDVPVTEITLASYSRVEGDAPARLAASALALAAALDWNRRSSELTLHLDGLARIVSKRNGWLDAVCPPSAFLVVLSALLRAPEEEADIRAATAQALEELARAQRGDGTWPEADAFHAAEVVLAACNSGWRNDATEGALRRVARLFASSQQRDGTWGRESGPRRTLAAWRVLRYALSRESSK